MATPDKMNHETAGVLADPGQIHATLRSLAVRVHRATRSEEAKPHELRDLARQICHYRRTIRHHLGDDIRLWLMNLQRHVEMLQEPALAVAEDSCR